MKKILLITLLFFVIFSCRSKKEFVEDSNKSVSDTIYVDNIVRDTIIIKKEIEVSKPVYFETEIPCDEDSKGKIGSGDNETSYEIKDGKIYLKTKIDSVRNSIISEYKSKAKSDSIRIVNKMKEKYSSQEEVVRYVYPFWIYILGSGLIFFALMWLRQKFWI